MASNILKLLKSGSEEGEAANIRRHVTALSCSKSADGLISPKLVLSWLLSNLGASSFWIGALVPVREAGALLPQLFTAPKIKSMARRKWAWAVGSFGQGACVLGMVLVALLFEDNVAGVLIVALLGILALFRSICSVSYKDVLGKTVKKTHRGQTTGAANTVSSVVVVIFAGILIIGPDEKFALVIGALGLAVVLWALAAMFMSRMEEEASDVGEREAISAPLSLLWENKQLRLFVIARALLVGTALAPPYMVILAGDEGFFSQLGALVLASSLGSLVSAYVWGWLADRSSRQVLIWSGVAGAVSLVLALIIGEGGGMAVALFAVVVAYHGVRQGRSTYLVDMAGEDDRATFTAISNTVIGVFLLVVGGIAAGLSSVSVYLVIGVFAVMCLAGGAVALKLDEVENG